MGGLCTELVARSQQKYSLLTPPNPLSVQNKRRQDEAAGAMNCLPVRILLEEGGAMVVAYSNGLVCRLDKIKITRRQLP